MGYVLRAAMTALPRARPSTLPEDMQLGTAVVDRAHLARYQQVCGFPLSDRLPLTYPHVLGFDLAMRLITRPDFPFGVVGLVHVNNRIEQLRPLAADDQLELTVQALDLRDHPRGRQFDVVTTALVDGEVVWRDTSTYLRRAGKTQGKAAGGDPKGTGGGSKSTGGDFDGIGGSSKSHRVDPPTPHSIWRIGTGVGTAYAEVSGDHNPIHTSWLGARLLGFPKPIAHGMWSKARCVAAIANRIPDTSTVDVSFKLPILLPATVGFTATAREFSLRDARTGRPHLTATIS